MRTTHHRSYLNQDPVFLAALHKEDPPTYRDPAPISSRVYFVIDHEAAQVKIGYTNSVPRRLRQLRHSRGREMDLLGVVEGDSALERILHERFEPYRIPGTREWYSTEIVAELMPLLAEW